MLNYAGLPQPLITPASMLPENLRAELRNNHLLDFGLEIEANRFEFYDTHCIVSTPLVLAYALAVASSGKAAQILMAGFDGYSPGDPRNDEIESMLAEFVANRFSPEVVSITPTKYKSLLSKSVYAI